MKHITNFRIFESVEPYPYEFDESENCYSFSDGKNKFEVEFSYIAEDDLYDLKWFLDKNGIYTYDIVNSNIYRLLNTIMGKILRDFIEKNDDCRHILIHGMSKRNEKSEITQRTNVYYRFLKNNPIYGWDLDRYQNEIYLDKKED